MLREYMHLEAHDSIDLAALAAIIANFAPDRLNPLWFVLIAASESGKSMLLDVILEGWKPVWKLPVTLSPGYFFSGRTTQGALVRIDKEDKRLLYMRDMAALTSIPQTTKGAIHSQIIGIYDGELRHETGMTSAVQVHQRTIENRLGWIGAATEVFYDRFLSRTYAVGARFSAYYWQVQTAHWSDHSHLAKQRDQRERALRSQPRVRAAVQAFLDKSLEHLRDFPRVTIPPEQSARIDAATTLVTRILGGDYKSPGGRTADRAVQFARSAAFLAGAVDVEEEHGDLGVRLVLSQLSPRYQNLLGYAVRRQLAGGDFWSFADFLREVGGRRSAYSEGRGKGGGLVETLIDGGVFERKRGRGDHNEMGLQIGRDAFGLVQAFGARCAVLQQRIAPDPPPPSVEYDGDEPAEISLDELIQ